MASHGKQRSQRPEYVIEHMEDLDADPTSPSTFPQWALLEYRQMLNLVGKGGVVHFTGLIAESSRNALERALSASTSTDDDVAQFKVHVEGVMDLVKTLNVDQASVCLLDPRSPTALSVLDAGLHQATDETSERPKDGPFQIFLFGGILGDDPPRDRTGILRALGFPTRHLGPVQMTTDTALGVTKFVVEDGLAMNLPESTDSSSAKYVASERKGPNGTLTWITHPELRFGQGESVQMPFRYIVDKRNADGQTPLMPPGMREHIRQDLDREIEF